MIHCIAIDDEPIALSIIENFCNRLPHDISIKLFSDPTEGIKYMNSSQTDILFLDIDINGVSGLDIAKTIPSNTSLIFTTAHSDYAIYGFDLCATDFLHKPFSFDRFNVAFNKAISGIEVNKSITVKVEYKNVNIELDDIVYIEAMDNYIKIHRNSNKMTLSQMSMKSIIELLPSADFIRIHRSYIIALREVVSYTKRQVTLNNGISLSVGRIYAEELYNQISLLP